ncbi:glutathione S-transferase [Algimonas arctica]|uniref:Glutathione S-transferase n=1 Tax=Algimonas arctica TaxID=1479486 RepID=A0A8J3G2S1_9PROT|nr:glutathione S-transferase family protein [Algimonas arctica]GHA97411.1 glutathione S-transferase [Algimonas arctica]
MRYRPAMQLYDYLPSGNSYKVRWVAAQLGLRYDHIDVDIHAGETQSKDFLALNPAGQIPLLILDDGRTLAESNAIIRYLADGSDLVPTDPYDHAKMLQWQFWEQYRHEPAIAVARFIRNYAHDTRSHELAALMPRGHAALAVMEAHLRHHDWFVGAQCSLADVSLYAYTHVAEEGGFDLSQYSALQTWLARFSAQANHIVITAKPNDLAWSCVGTS